MANALREYLRQQENTLGLGTETEHSFSPALKTFLESLGESLEALNEPRRINCGAPDFQVFQGHRDNRRSLDYIETKVLGVPLDEIERSEQLLRYRSDALRWFRLQKNTISSSLRERFIVGQMKRIFHGLSERMASISFISKVILLNS